MIYFSYIWRSQPTMKYTNYIKTIVLILGSTSILNTNILAQNCVWEHESEIDCNYNLSIGFTCDCGFNTHEHQFTAPFYCPTDCGCWGTPGIPQRTAGCGVCGWNDDTLCALIGNPTTNAYKFLRTQSIVPTPSVQAGIIAYDWRDVTRQVKDCNTTIINTLFCCANIDPDKCTPCGCGVVEIDWLNSKTYLRPAHDPYYLPCPNPNP